MIEGGANNKDVASVVNPVFYLQNLLPTTKTALFYKGNKSKQLADREPIVPSGGTLGGGSSINFICTHEHKDQTLIAGTHLVGQLKRCGRI